MCSDTYRSDWNWNNTEEACETSTFIYSDIYSWDNMYISGSQPFWLDCEKSQLGFLKKKHLKLFCWYIEFINIINYCNILN